MLFIFLCIASVGALVFAEYSGRTLVKMVAKPLASAFFVALGLSRAPLDQASFASLGAPSWIVVGLVLGAVGDVALLSRTQGAFLGGLGAFLLGHLAYAVAFAKLSPVATWLSVLGIPVVLSCGTVLAWLWPRLGPMRLPVTVYVSVIAVMTIAALAVFRTGAPGGGPIAVGALLFAASDVAVARERFVADRFVNKAWGLPAYYAGQLFIAWAAGA